MREVVGVVGNVKRASITEPATPEYYIPMEQAPIAMPHIALRVSGDPMSYATAVHSAVASLDKGAPIYRMNSYSDDMQRTSAQQRFQTTLLTSFAGIALLLAAIGLYGVLSYMVSQRTIELGLRIALGAQRSNVLQLILLRGLGLAVVGLCIGIATAALLSHFISGVLYQVKPLDALTFVGTSLVLLIVSCVGVLFLRIVLRGWIRMSRCAPSRWLVAGLDVLTAGEVPLPTTWPLSITVSLLLAMLALGGLWVFYLEPA